MKLRPFEAPRRGRVAASLLLLLAIFPSAFSGRSAAEENDDAFAALRRLHFGWHLDESDEELAAKADPRPELSSLEERALRACGRVVAPGLRPGLLAAIPLLVRGDGTPKIPDVVILRAEVGGDRIEFVYGEYEIAVNAVFAEAETQKDHEEPADAFRRAWRKLLDPEALPKETRLGVIERAEGFRTVNQRLGGLVRSWPPSVRMAFERDGRWVSIDMENLDFWKGNAGGDRIAGSWFDSYVSEAIRSRFDPESAEDRETYPRAARLAARAVVERAIGRPLQRRDGRRFRMDQAHLLEACLRGEAEEKEARESALLAGIRKHFVMWGHTSPFASVEDERAAFETHLQTAAREDLAKVMEHLGSVTDELPAKSPRYRMQELQRILDPVRNSSGLVVADPFLSPSSSLMKRVRIPEAELLAYRDLVLQALEKFEAGCRAQLESKGRVQPNLLARVLRTREHCEHLFGEARLGTETERRGFEALLERKIREQRASVLARVTPRVESLLAGRIPGDVIAAKYSGPSLYSTSLSWTLSALLEYLWWGLRIGEDLVLPWPEDRLAGMLEWCIEKHAESLARGEGTERDRRVAQRHGRLLPALAGGLLKKLRDEAKRVPCFERISPLWYFGDE